jgi:hypothetical protein
MNTCPPEIHSYICQLACTDNGQTVRSLTLVSKYFSDVARPFLYQSIAITRLDQIVPLLARLEGIPHHMRHIRHLFVSDDHKNSPSPGVIKRRLAEAEKTSIIHVLVIAAPTLESLTLSASCTVTSTSLIGGLFNIVFPRLVELTVVGYYPFPHIPNSLPRLERLHLRGNRNPHGLLQFGTLDAVCPRLTHLRVSDLSMAVSFIDELKDALTCRLADTDANAASSVYAGKLPRHVSHVVIQPCPEPIKKGHRSSYLKDQIMAERLAKFALNGVDVGAKYVRYVLLERSAPDEVQSESVRHDWSDRLDGGDGCWRVPSPV